MTAIQTMFEPTWESLGQFMVPDWYQDAKFGIFIHWGVYAVPAFANEWYSRNMYQPDSPEFAHHVATYGPQASFGYKDFIPGLTGARFDPAAWVELFRQAGARYIIPVAEHHDGFAMYDSAHTDWKATRMGPRRDVVGALAQAARQAGLVFGLSNHRAENWWFFEGGRRFPSDVQDPRNAGLYGPAQPEETQPDRPFLEDWLARAIELVELYQPQVVYFDWWVEQPAFEPYLREFAAYYYNRGAEWGRGVAINYKHDAFPEGSAIYGVERGKLAGMRERFWQADTSISNSSWCHVEPGDYKPAGALIADLVDVVSKNGTLLLNVGPRADGSIPEQEQAILREMGAWLDVNGEAIYGTRPWLCYGEGPTPVGEGKWSEGQSQPFTSEDIRFTIKGDALYAIAMGAAPAITIRTLGEDGPLPPERIAAIGMLGTDEPLGWTWQPEGLTIRMPERLPCGHAYAFKLSLR